MGSDVRKEIVFKYLRKISIPESGLRKIVDRSERSQEDGGRER